jgi:hypothetical protein
MSLKHKDGESNSMMVNRQGVAPSAPSTKRGPDGLVNLTPFMTVLGRTHRMESALDARWVDYDSSPALNPQLRLAFALK